MNLNTFNSYEMNNYTDEQITKLGCDAFAFFEAARLIVEHRDSFNAHPISTVYVSLSTAMMVNIGLCLELNLKLLHAKLKTPIISNELHTHSLVELYDLLDPHTQSQLMSMFEDLTKEGATFFVAYVSSKDIPEQPSGTYKSTFRNFLDDLDAKALFLQRYSFETYSSQEWWHVIDFEFSKKLVSRLTKFANTL